MLMDTHMPLYLFKVLLPSINLAVILVSPWISLHHAAWDHSR